MENKKIIITEDGSASILNTELNEIYHSEFGAVQESKHVFIEAGLKQFPRNSNIRIFELGFGTGLNCFLTLKESGNFRNIYYHTIEKHPIEAKLLKQLNYSEIGIVDEALFWKIHNLQSGNELILSNQFYLKKITSDFCSFQFTENYDLFFFDAFSPEVQPELWTDKIFIKIFESLNNNGILVTYSAKGMVRRSLQKAGFEVERIPGPPGKREMLRARKTILSLNNVM